MAIPAALARALLPKGERVEIVDAARGGLRVAVLDEGRLEAALYVTRNGGLPHRDWLIAQLAAAESARRSSCSPAARQARCPIAARSSASASTSA